MTSIDDRIKEELERDSAEIDKMLKDDGGLSSMIRAGYRGSMGGWMKLVIGMEIVLMPVWGWLVYRFAVAGSVDDRVWWGIWMALSGITLMLLELWLWLEVHRASTRREIKRIELAIAELASSLRGKPD
ncbi:DUF6768 family protein [Kordiimonas marina]|uniref:DUF6768 family protein n=1 Tax=Kordiimonas marina TaxID=2872312 RepID=UPI001FF46F0D|nr:DUF6768 family protein [Kordiimonas marina]MCJ9429391.1 hypothetical protein [Kordiimonas marina]